MTKNYKIEHSNGITRINFLHKPTYEDAQNIIDNIAENYPYEKRLWDLTDINFNFTMKEIQSISEYGKLKFTKPNRLALIAPDDLAYGEMRALMVYREQVGHSDSMVFRTEQEAIDWLNT